MSALSEADGRRDRRLLRLESHLRAQYGLAVVCVVVLALTGLPQRFESLSLSREVIDLAGGIENLRLVHHVAGGALVLTGVYHVALVLAAVLVLREAAPLRMIPSPRDFRDAVQTFAYFVRLKKEPPEGRSPRYFQKVDYWFMAWSLAVMAVTGLLNLLPLRAARLLSADMVLASLRTHGDAAPLVVAWVVVVHLLYSGLTPPLFEVKAIAARTAPPVARLRDAAATAAGGASGAVGVAPVTSHNPGRPQGEDWEGPA